MEWGPLFDHARAVRVRVGREPPAPDRALAVDPPDVARFRLRATHLHRRLGAEDLRAAAFGGLQDSAPRDALLALHARLPGVGPSSWEDPSLTQIWFRWSDYVVPTADVGVFTLGTLPRDPDRRASLDALADLALAALDGAAMPSRALARAIPDLPDPFWLRTLSATGKIHIRWDARSVTVLPARPVDLDEEVARVELARRFLGWLGPAGHRHFAKWAGVSRDDAETTWRALADELVPVALAGRERWLLAEDEAALAGERGGAEGEAIAGVRFVPGGDPYIYLDRGLVVPAPPARVTERQPGAEVSRRVLNSLWGRVVLDGVIVASWGRSGGDVTVAPWVALGERRRRLVAAAARELGPVLGREVRLRWLD